MSWFQKIANTTRAFRGIGKKTDSPGLGYPGAIFFSTNKKTAKDYAWRANGDHGEIIEAFITISNPAPDQVQRQIVQQFGYDNVVPELKKLGYDGYIVADEWAVFDESQIQIVSITPYEETTIS